ncbi:hypothetical protein GCM10028798_25720 [Humibacter antri]
MAATVTQDDVPPENDAADADVNRLSGSAPSRARLRWMPGASMVVIVSIGFLLPLLRNHTFYYWDDTVGAAVGVWQRIGSDVLSGQLPFLELGMWRGGNFLAEAATGMWNPVMLGLMVVTHPIDNLAVAIGIAKWCLFVIEALGIYVLAREYGARRWWAALAGASVTIAGWELFVDGTAWINATAGEAFLPWAWWAMRRAYRSGFRPGATAIAIVCGYVLVSTGNPYSVVALAVVGGAVAVEAALARHWRDIWWILGIGAVVALLCVIVYVTFALTSQVGFRADSGIYNDESLSPNLSNLLGLSMPVYKPWIMMFGRPMTMPGVYLAWFFLPLLPWLRWRASREEWRPLVGILAFAGFFLLFILGPSQLGMFRWPGRLLPFAYLAMMVFFVVLLGRGLHRDRVGLRVTLTVVAVSAGAWMAFSDLPQLWKWIGICALATFGLLAVAWFWAKTPTRLYTVLSVGTLLFLGAQVMVTPANGNVTNYDFTQSRSEIQSRVQGRYQGMTVFVTQFGGPGIKPGPNGVWRDFLPGDMPAVAGVESPNAYSGIGFTKLDQALCMQYNGMTCPNAWNALFAKARGFDVTLADQLRAETVVVQRGFVRNLHAPSGWSLAEKTASAYVFKRDAPVPFGEGRVSYVGDGVDVTRDSMQGQWGESVEFRAGSGGDRRIVFARLAWPGYSAQIAGHPVEVRTTAAGLAYVEVPANISSGTLSLTWTPPGLLIGVAAATLGVALWVLLAVLGRRRRRADRNRKNGTAGD